MSKQRHFSMAQRKYHKILHTLLLPSTKTYISLSKTFLMLPYVPELWVPSPQTSAILSKLKQCCLWPFLSACKKSLSCNLSSYLLISIFWSVSHLFCRSTITIHAWWGITYFRIIGFLFTRISSIGCLLIFSLVFLLVYLLLFWCMLLFWKSFINISKNAIPKRLHRSE